MLGAVGYDAIMLDFLSSPRLANWHCIHYQLKHDSNALSWEELPLLYESSIVNEILIPLGYRNGIALPLRGNSGQLVGWAHTSSSRYKFDSEGRAELMRTRSILATLVQSEAKIWQLTPREREILRSSAPDCLTQKSRTGCSSRIGQWERTLKICCGSWPYLIGYKQRSGHSITASRGAGRLGRSTTGLPARL